MCFSHNFLLFRLAFTSGFGSNVFLSGASGIWQTTEQNFEQAESLAAQSTSLGQAVMAELGFPFDELTFGHMSIPYFNALTVYILIQVGIVVAGFSKSLR